jgi:hypothetical protein
MQTVKRQNDKVTVYVGVLHDDYTDEKGRVVLYDQVIAGTWKGNTFKATSFPDLMTFDLSKKDFKEKVTDVFEYF